jgi:predicted permease
MPCDMKDTTTIPSAFALALFAFFGTWVVARRGFGHKREERLAV